MNISNAGLIKGLIVERAQGFYHCQLWKAAALVCSITRGDVHEHALYTFNKPFIKQMNSSFLKYSFTVECLCENCFYLSGIFWTFVKENMIHVINEVDYLP